MESLSMIYFILTILLEKDQDNEDEVEGARRYWTGDRTEDRTNHKCLFNKEE